MSIITRHVGIVRRTILCYFARCHLTSTPLTSYPDARGEMLLKKNGKSEIHFFGDVYWVITPKYVSICQFYMK
jgi:hypothetical protein